MQWYFNYCGSLVKEKRKNHRLKSAVKIYWILVLKQLKFIFKKAFVLLIQIKIAAILLAAISSLHGQCDCMSLLFVSWYYHSNNQDKKFFTG